MNEEASHDYCYSCMVISQALPPSFDVNLTIKLVNNPPPGYQDKGNTAELIRCSYEYWHKTYPNARMFSLEEFKKAVKRTQFNVAAEECQLQRNLYLSNLFNTNQSLRQFASKNQLNCESLEKMLKADNKKKISKILHSNNFSKNQSTPKMLSDDVILASENNNEIVASFIAFGELCHQGNLKEFTKEVIRVQNGIDWSSEDMENIHLGDIQLAVQLYSEFCLHSPEKYMNFACGWCAKVLPLHKTRLVYAIVKDFPCQCSLCLTCYDEHLMSQITKKPVIYWHCGNCHHPKACEIFDKDNNDSALIRLIEEWSTRLNDIKWHGDAKILKLFNDKVHNYNLLKDPRASECPRCGYVSLYLSDNYRVQCYECHRHFCRNCNVLWNTQHENNSCEEMQYFIKLEELGSLGDNCIACPSCKTVVEKVPGRCEHFDCQNPICDNKFCPCGVLFYNKCPLNVALNCDVKGFHGHHPRNCITHLRNLGEDSLKSLLQTHKVPYQINNPSKKCTKLVGLENKECQKVSVEMGLCQLHLLLYLSELVIKHKLDPIKVMNDVEIKAILHEGGLEIPVKKENETVDNYFQRIKEVLIEKWPLNALKPLK